MAVTALTPVEITSLYPTAGAAIAWTNGDAANDNDFPASGREVLLVRNASADTAHSITIVSVPDSLGRTGDVTESIPFGEERAYMLGNRGFRSSSGRVRIHPAHADIQFCVLQLPR
jgi:hypothetical protein